MNGQLVWLASNGRARVVRITVDTVFQYRVDICDRVWGWEADMWYVDPVKAVLAGADWAESQ